MVNENGLIGLGYNRFRLLTVSTLIPKGKPSRQLRERERGSYRPTGCGIPEQAWLASLRGFWGVGKLMGLLLDSTFSPWDTLVADGLEDNTVQ